MRNLLIKLAAGAVGGLAATFLMTKAMPHARRLPERFRPTTPSKDPSDFLVAQGERLVGALSPKVHRGAAQGLRIAYGLTWPIGLAALSNVLKLRSTGKTMAAGAVLGAVCWLIGYEGWLPALGLTPPAHRVGLGRNASGLASHVAYGTLAALPLAVAGPRIKA